MYAYFNPTGGFRWWLLLDSYPCFVNVRRKMNLNLCKLISRRDIHGKRIVSASLKIGKHPTRIC